MTLDIPGWVFVPIAIITVFGIPTWWLARKGDGKPLGMMPLFALAVFVMGLCAAVGFVAGRFWPR